MLTATLPLYRRASNTPVNDLVFRLCSVAKEYSHPVEPVLALDEVTAEIPSGVVAILGPSGQGKTTLLNLLGGLDQPTRGEVWFRDIRLQFGNGRWMDDYRSRRVAWVFQDLNLISHQTAAANAAFPLLCRGVARSTALDTARSSLAELGLDSEGDRYPNQLSRGQQQRVAIARAFTSGAEVVLADEPTGSLDPEKAQEVMTAFTRLSRQTGVPVIMVTHDHSLAESYCDHVLICSGRKLSPQQPAKVECR